MHPAGTIVASGALGREPALHVWDTTSLQPLAVLPGATHSGGICALAFSSDGQYLASCDNAPSPLIALWDWRRGTLVASARTGRQRVLGLAFSPRGLLVSYGAGPLRFWSADGTRLISRRGVYGGMFADGTSASRGGSRRTILCVAFTGDGEGVLCGTADGCIQQWDAHGQCVDVSAVNRQQPLFALHCSNAFGLVASGKGGRLLWWVGPRRLGEPIIPADARCLDLSRALGGAADGVGPAARLPHRPCAVCAPSRARRVGWCSRRVAASSGSCHCLGSSDPSAGGPIESAAAATLLTQGHSASSRRGGGVAVGEACALAADPVNPDRFATGGDDGTVRVWSVSSGRMLSMRKLPLAVSSLCYTSDGAHLAAGCACSSVYVVHADTLSDALVFSLAASSSSTASAGSAAAAASGITPLGGPVSFAVVPPGPTPTSSSSSSAALSGSSGGGPIGCLAYSPDDTKLAVGLASGDVEVLAVGAHYRRLRTLALHPSPVLHMDWSSDGAVLQTACARREYHFWRVASGERVLNLPEVKDVEWHTWSSPSATRSRASTRRCPMAPTSTPPTAPPTAGCWSRATNSVRSTSSATRAAPAQPPAARPRATPLTWPSCASRATEGTSSRWVGPTFSHGVEGCGRRRGTMKSVRHAGGR